MSVKKRSDAFMNAVVTKKLNSLKSVSHANHFRSLVFQRRLIETLFSGLLVFGGQQFLIQNAFFSPIWPAAAVGLSALFLRGNFLLVGLFAGSFLSYIINDYSIGFSLAQSSVYIIFLFLTRSISLKWLGPITPLAKISTWCGFLAILIVMCAMHVWGFFKIMALANLFTPTAENRILGWLGELSAILCLVPLSLIFDPFVPSRYFNRGNWRWWTVSLLIIASQFLYYFLPPLFPIWILPTLFMFCLIGYASIFGQLPLTITLFGLSVIYLGGVQPPGTLFHIYQSFNQITLILSFFMVSILFSLSIAIFRNSKTYANI